MPPSGALEAAEEAREVGTEAEREGGGRGGGRGGAGTGTPMAEKALAMADVTACVAALCTASERPAPLLPLPLLLPLVLLLLLLLLLPLLLLLLPAPASAFWAARECCSRSLAKPRRSARSLASCAKISFLRPSEMLGTAASGG